MNKNTINKVCRKFGFEVHGLGYVQSLEKTSFKEDAFKKQKDLLPNAKMIFDVGANRGDTVLQYKELYPASKIHAFEPFRSSFDILVKNTFNASGVFPHQCALTNSVGKKELHVNKNVDTNSLLPSLKAGMSSDTQVETLEKVEVDTYSLTSFCYKTGIEYIDILKLDIQGGEMQALKGAEHLLSYQAIKLIYLEAWFVKQYKGSPLFHDISSYLATHNYYIQDLYNPIYANGSLAWCDAIFLPR